MSNKKGAGVLFLHLGGDIMISQQELVAVIDLESATNAVTTREFIQTVNAKDLMHEIGEKDKGKSLIITTKNIYLSPISSYTLLKRANLHNLTLEID
ncbi:MAG TPA: extracellular matrix/biofilm biosynthesis regulator RemA family protein [Candidatus Deferrimicrobium sp.]|nr:extracellular matrix/biofilm biosynthesis regulator RemA family protein [Candidatus Deferrimicrobium sp.]